MPSIQARAALVARLRHPFHQFSNTVLTGPRATTEHMPFPGHRTVAEIDELVRLRKAGL